MRAEIEARTQGTPFWRRTVTRVRSLRRLTVVGIVALMLAVPVAVSANHLFSDVPTSSTYHTTVARLAGAGITGGCGGGKYCPNAAVTRGQMAAFLNRGLGRGSGGEFGTDDDDWASILDYSAAAETSLISGGGGGGTAHVFATSTISLWTSEDGVCPCEVQAFLVNATTDESSLTQYAMIGTEEAPADPEVLPLTTYAETNLTVSYLFTVASGALNDLVLVVKVIPTTVPTAPGLTGYTAGIQAIYVPFGSDGTNPLSPATAGSSPGKRGD
jgi:hypothetical protein